ncbi:MAG: hypothetical protein GXC94_02175 [Comamonadaceae bacterium]|jgi:hypothetical protein|nr:hypothetical protein [Comamonadaceae bacterium]
MRSSLHPFWQRRSVPVRLALFMPAALLCLVLAAADGIREALPHLRSAFRDLRTTPRLR